MRSVLRSACPRWLSCYCPIKVLDTMFSYRNDRERTGPFKGPRNSLHFSVLSSATRAAFTLQDTLVAAVRTTVPHLAQCLARCPTRARSPQPGWFCQGLTFSLLIVGLSGSSCGRLQRWPSSRTRACPTSKCCASSWRAASWTSRTTAPTCCTCFLGHGRWAL